MTTTDDIRRWLNDADKDKHSHMIVVVDLFDYTCYPVYVEKGTDPRDEFIRISQSPMQAVEEVYDLSKDYERQLNTIRVMNF